MQKICFNNDWRFAFDQEIEEYNHFGLEKYASVASGGANRFLEYNNWKKVDLPHDWEITLERNPWACTFSGARCASHYHRYKIYGKIDDDMECYNIGWYRKDFSLSQEYKDKRVFIEFEGVFRDSHVWINGTHLDSHFSGYTSFIIEITDHVVFDTTNSVVVRVDSENHEGWWYEGAGIYRNVHLLVCEPTYFKHNSIFVKTDINGEVRVGGKVVNDTNARVNSDLCFEILDKNGVTVAKSSSQIQIDAYANADVSDVLKVENPLLWSVDEPYLYTLKSRVGNEEVCTKFGIRTVAFDKEAGFLLNGKPLKVRGACVHQDFGGVGVALTDNLQYYKIAKLKEMGVNAYRCSHHAPSPVLLNACDELGMLVMDETRTFGTSPEALRQLTDLVERDRNHPCVFIWSLGNEEFAIQNVEWSARLMEKVSRICKSLDDTRPVTYGGNNGPNFIGANKTAEIRGVNYIRNGSKAVEEHWMDVYHREHPDQPIIGTEESSYVLSRGGAVNDFGSGLIDSTGNVTMPWGSTPKGWVKFSELRPYFAGSFMWTGFDYRGEPNPFQYTNNSSSFGTIDLCGMEKPPFYYYQAWWKNEPVLKITPHWNFKKGEKVTLAVFTNCEEITLFINGREIESRKVERFDAPLFNVEYEEGEVSVKGVRDGKVYSDTIKTAGKEKALITDLVLSANDDKDIAIYEITAVDKNGIVCPLSNKEIEIDVTGATIVGVGNGDPSYYGYEQKPDKEKSIIIRTFNYEKGTYSIPPKTPNLMWDRLDWLEFEDKLYPNEDDYRLVAKYGKNQVEEKFTFTTTVDGVQGYEYIEFERLGANATVYINGKYVGSNVKNGSSNTRPYRFYYKFRNGKNEIKVVSEKTKQHDVNLDHISGIVKIGKVQKEPWNIPLHYGKARVFVKTDDITKAKIKVKFTK